MSWWVGAYELWVGAYELWVGAYDRTWAVYRVALQLKILWEMQFENKQLSSEVPNSKSIFE